MYFEMMKTQMCLNFMRGRCKYSALECLFSHSKDNFSLCDSWLKGECTGIMGNLCRFRHYYTEQDAHEMRSLANKEKLVGVNDCLNGQDVSESPYRVKVVKETRKERREEVDLETGKRKSWIESMEFEVLDITGETPVKKSKLDTDVRKMPLSEIENSKEIEGNRNPLTKMLQSSRFTFSATVDLDTCPVCLRKFKGEKGVKSHRSARNSACRLGKENLRQESSSELVKATSPIVISSSQDTNDSIIVVPDSP